MIFIRYYDTSALLSIDQRDLNEDVYVSSKVLIELESIKNNTHKDESVRAAARSLVKALIRSSNCPRTLTPRDERQIEKILKRKGLALTNDNFILAEAAYHFSTILSKYAVASFLTSDGVQYLIAVTYFPELHPIFINGEKISLWQGYKKFTSSFSDIESSMNHNVLNLEINEYGILNDDTVIKWDGKGNKIIESKSIRNISLGEIKPLNVEQIMAFDLLANKDTMVKLLTGVYGSGKDLLMLSQALSDVERGKFNKIIFCRNLFTLSDTPDQGFLPGTLMEKTEWQFGPILDKLGGIDVIKQLMDLNQLEVLHLPFARGRQFDNSIIYVTEGQNLSTSQIALLLGRCGPGTQLWINGDYQQIDKNIFQRDSGIKSLIERLKGNSMFGHVYMPQTLRSKTAELATLLLS